MLNTVVIPLLMHWSYSSPALSHRYVLLTFRWSANSMTLTPNKDPMFWVLVIELKYQAYKSGNGISWLRTGIGSLITRFVGPALGPSGANRTQVGPMLAPWTLLSGLLCLLLEFDVFSNTFTTLVLNVACVWISKYFQRYNHFQWYTLCIKQWKNGRENLGKIKRLKGVGLVGT